MVEGGHQLGGGFVGDGPEGDDHAGGSGGEERSREAQNAVVGDPAPTGVAGAEDDEIGVELEVEDFVGGE